MHQGLRTKLHFYVLVHRRRSMRYLPTTIKLTCLHATTAFYDSKFAVGMCTDPQKKILSTYTTFPRGWSYMVGIQFVVFQPHYDLIWLNITLVRTVLHHRPMFFSEQKHFSSFYCTCYSVSNHVSMTLMYCCCTLGIFIRDSMCI